MTAARRHDAQNQPDAALPKLSADGRARFESMWQSVMHKHGDRFTDEQKMRIRRIISRNVFMLDSVYAIEVTNGEGPATVLRLVDGAAPDRPGGLNARTRQPAARKR